VVQGAQVGNGDAIEIQGVNFAGRATAGNLNIIDISGNLTTANLTLEKSNTPINGVTATNEVCLEVINGSLTVAANISGGSNAALRAGNDINFTLGNVSAVNASLETVNGSITDNNANVDVNATNFVALANGSVGSQANGLEVSVNNIAAQSTTGMWWSTTPPAT
jgi:hypothetical protein